MREVRVFDGKDHAYFTYSEDLVLMESLLFTLGQSENPLRTKFVHDWEPWLENFEMGFAPVFKKHQNSHYSDPYYLQ